MGRRSASRAGPEGSEDRTCMAPGGCGKVTNLPTTEPGRRDFLKTAGGVAAASLLPRAYAASDRISVAFIGVGVMGTENLKAAMAQTGVAVSAVCDVYQPSLERAAAIARRAGHQPKEV